jgi:hypothetical protein
MIPDTLADDIDNDDRDLDASNDLEYLLGLIGDGLGDDDFEDDTARAKCAVAEWCRAIGYVPDIDSYESGQTTPPDDMRDENSWLGRQVAAYNDILDIIEARENEQ